jgi:membrane protein DedA with SNARE-associated domain
VALGIVGLFADGFGPVLALKHPLLQIMLDPKLRYLILTAPRVAPVPWFVAGFVRLTLADPLWYLLGRWYGEDATRFIERHLGARRLIRVVERWFSRVSWLIVIVVPDGFVLLAGATEMPPLVFALLDLVGTVGRLLLVLVLAGVLAGPLSAATHLIAGYQWWLVALSLAIGGVHVVRLLQATRRARV